MYVHRYTDHKPFETSAVRASDGGQSSAQHCFSSGIKLSVNFWSFSFELSRFEYSFFSESGLKKISNKVC